VYMNSHNEVSSSIRTTPFLVNVSEYLAQIKGVLVVCPVWS